VKETSGKAWSGIKKAAVATGKGISKAAKATGKGISKAAKATGKGISKAAKATGKGIRKAGRSIFNWGKKIYSDMKKHLTKYGCRRYHFQCLYGTRETRKQGKVGNQKLCRAVKTICYMLAEDPSLKKQVVIETDRLFMNDEDTDALEKSIAKTVDISKAKGSKFHAAVKKAVNELYNALSPKCQHDFMTLHAAYKKDASKLAKEEYKGDMLGHIVDNKDMGEYDASKYKFSQKFKQFHKNCMEVSLNQGMQQLTALLQIAGGGKIMEHSAAMGEHDGFFLSTFLESVMTALFGG